MLNGTRHFKWQGANSGFQKNLRNSTSASLLLRTAPPRGGPRDMKSEGYKNGNFLKI